MPEVCDTVLDVVGGHRGVHGVDEQSEVLLRAIDHWTERQAHCFSYGVERNRQSCD